MSTKVPIPRTTEAVENDYWSVLVKIANRRPYGSTYGDSAFLKSRQEAREILLKIGIWDLVRNRNKWTRRQQIIVAMAMFAAEIERLSATSAPEAPRQEDGGPSLRIAQDDRRCG